MSDVARSRQLMLAFAERTGVTGPAAPRRYLWTDAFATCNLLGLHAETGDTSFRELALTLVDQVHHVLGRHREDGPRRGWISGLSEIEGELHPTRGGLRIGKPLPERGPGEPLDPELEWDRDGQYLHYLTKWMHALARVSEHVGEPRYRAWAVELATVTHAAFAVERRSGGPVRYAWKMSTDLARPLVPSSGHHDPLDALVTYLDLDGRSDGALAREIAEAEKACRGRRWATDDALGAGGLLVDAFRLSGLAARGDEAHGPLLQGVLQDAVGSLRAVERSGLLRLPRTQRLPFREIGLAVGLRAIEALGTTPPAVGPAGRLVDELAASIPLADVIEGAWTSPAAQRAATWAEHEDINAVTLATSLLPRGFLGTAA